MHLTDESLAILGSAFAWPFRARIRVIVCRLQAQGERVDVFQENYINGWTVDYGSRTTDGRRSQIELKQQYRNKIVS